MSDATLIKRFKNKKKIELEQITVDKTYGKFEIQPFERGFGITVGNSLRRVLLSSIPGYAITAVKIDVKGKTLSNEYESIPGVIQDTPEILLNLKKVNITLLNNIQEKIIHVEVKNQKEFYAKDLAVDSDIKVSNEDFLIFSTNGNVDFTMDLQINIGSGYTPAEKMVKYIETIGTIPVDAIYSPIEKVLYKVDQVTVGDNDNFEKLIIEIWTNGNINPEDALFKAHTILKDNFSLFAQEEEEISDDTGTQDTVESGDDKSDIYDLPVSKGEFTVRTMFFFKVNDIKYIGDLVSKTEENLRNLKYFNDNVMDDITIKLDKMGLKIGLKNIDYKNKNKLI